ncbi:hypothetical protein ACW0TR_05380 [Fusobacterium polymorphum]
MKKIIVFFLIILSINIFAKEYRPYLKKNTNNKNLVFSAQIEDDNKVVSIYKENKKLIYVYGLEGERAEKTIVGVANKNLFKNGNEIPLNENNNNRLRENFILFKVKNYTYLISFYNNYGVKENSYTLRVARNDEETLFDKSLDILTIYDNLFDKDFFKKLPYDNGTADYYATYD